MFAVQRTCPACRGSGSIPGQKCTQCKGTGVVQTQRRVMVKIPPGTRNNQTLRLRGLGSPGTAGGTPGDLLVNIAIKPHKTFHLEGDNLVAMVNIPFSKALLGSTINLRHPNGKNVKVKIPRGTKPGTRLRITGMGVPRRLRHGDMLIEIAYEIPKNLTPEQEEALQKFE